MAARGNRAVSKRLATLPAPPPRAVGIDPARALALPLGFTLLLLALSFAPAVRESEGLLRAFIGAGVVLLGWTAALMMSAKARGRRLVIEVALLKQHYLQACAQFSVLLYWGMYWHQVYDSMLLIAAQLVFAYAFDTLLTWSRRDVYTLGFAPFPVIFSTNLFLWFKPEWFYLQFLLVAVGFAAKQLLQWNKDGRRSHIFNPSSFPLGVFSVFLILAGASGLTWGEDIATTQFNPPHIYLLIFLVSLPGQFLFGVASTTLSAVATSCLCGLLYSAATGSQLFLEPPIPIAIFLGMHLLFTDPSTSPRTELGRIIFGMLYGLSVVVLFLLLGRLGVPTFYDKLLPVPLLNLMIRGIDRIARSDWLKRIDPARLGRGLAPRRRNLAYMSVWAVLFATLQFLTGTQATLARGDSLMTQGRQDEAVVRYREVVQAEPANLEAHSRLGLGLMQTGQADEARATLQRASELQPASPEAHNNLGVALMQSERFAEAVPVFQRAVDLKPDYSEARFNLANAFNASGRPDSAVLQYREALRLRPDWPAALASLAWIEATETGALRNPDDALRLALGAAELTGRKDAQVLDVLAAAYAAGGRFEEAARTAEQAEAIATGSAPDLAEQIRSHLSLYRAGRPLVLSGQ